MNRLQIVKRIGDLSEEHCQSCKIQATAKKERPTCKAEDYCPGCEVYTELRSLGNQLMNVTKVERKQKEQVKKGMGNVAKLEMTVEEFVSLRDQGNSIMKIAKMKGVTDPAVHNWRKKNKEAIQKAQEALGQTKTKNESETTKLIKQTVEPAGERQYSVLKAAVKQLEGEVAAWKERAEKAERELSQRDDDKEAMRQANIQLANDNKKYKEEVDNLTEARIAAENELDQMSEEYTKSAEALRLARDEGAFAQKRLEQQDYELENLRHNLKITRDSLENAVKENQYLKGLVKLWA